MSTLQRIVQLAQVGINKLLDRAENPNDTLDLAYENLVTGLQATKRSLADLVAQAASLKRQIEGVDQDIQGAEADARTALNANREDLARKALEEKQAIVRRRQIALDALSQLEPQVNRLFELQRQQQEGIEGFKAKKETMKATYTAAQAQVKVAEQLSGLDQTLLGTGDAFRRAEEKVNNMQDRATALGGMLEHGILTDMTDSRSSTQKQIEALKATAAVDDDLARLKAENPKNIEKKG